VDDTRRLMFGQGTLLLTRFPPDLVGPESLEVLARGAGHEDPEVRASAAGALEKFATNPDCAEDLEAASDILTPLLGRGRQRALDRTTRGWIPARSSAIAGTRNDFHGRSRTRGRPSPF
jgi:hypothetical protein